MSLRDLFTGSRETHSRKHRRTRQAELIPAQVERLETRSLLSAVIPGLDQHGLVFTNGNVAGRETVVLDGSINPRISNNANGAGLFVALGGQTGLKNLVLTGLRADNNGSAGAVIDLRDMQLDSLVVDASFFRSNGGAGLVIRLNNADIGRIVLRNSRLNSNQADGFCVTSTNSRITVLRAVGNRASANANGDGMVLQADRSSIANLGVAVNILRANGSNGVQIKLTETPVPNLTIRDNSADGNVGGHGVFLDFIGSAVTLQAFRNQLINQEAGDGFHIRTQFSSAGLRNINLAKFSVNNFEGNAGNGFFAELARDTTLRGQILANTFRNNGGIGLGATAEDTENAIDLQIGSLRRVNNVLVHANTFDQNTSAAIALTLQDPSNNPGDTTGRFRILGNTILNTSAGTVAPFTGDGIHIRAIGSTVLANGAARWSQIRIDHNTIAGNAGHGVKFDISEDSQLVDVVVGNNTGTRLRFNVDGDFTLPGAKQILEPSDGNVIQDNGGNGILLLRRDSSVVREIRFLDNVIRRNRNGIAVVARNTYEAVATAATRGNLVSEVQIRNNQVRDNSVDGIHLRTEADAVLLADIHYNFIDNNGRNTGDPNAGNGIRASGLENNATDFENIGGTWTKNRISNNAQNGIAIQTVTGNVNPLLIGLDGLDAEFEPFELGRQSLGNFIFANGEDGIDLTSLSGLPGTPRPFDSIANRMSIVNNLIVSNGRNAFAAGTPNPYTAGKGIDLDNFQGDLREVHVHRNVIQSNAGDGIEIRNGGGRMRFFALGNVIDLNGGRGVDVLNQTGAINFSPTTHIVFGDVGTTLAAGVAMENRNQIRSNGLEGFYVVNTSSSNQTQDVDSRTDLLADGLIGVFPNLMLDIDTNVIRDNGRGIDETGSPASTLSGTGLVVRVGTSNSAELSRTVPDISGNAAPFSDRAAAGVGTNTSEFGNGRVNARVVDNQFSGNAGDDVFMESFTSTVDPPTTPGTWTDKEFKDFEPAYRRDPLARMNLVFTGNTGESLDVVRGFFSTNGNNAGAKYDNPEPDFKSRNRKQAPNPSGPFDDAARPRNAQRVADRPVFLDGLGDLGDAYDGIPFGGFSGGFFSGIPFVPANRAQLFTGSLSFVDARNQNGPIVVTVAGRTGSVEDATNANPSVITSRNHGLFTGDLITITGATGNTAINSSNSSTGQWRVVFVSFDEFTLEDPGTGVAVAGNGAYDVGSASWTEPGAHGLSDGNLVTLSDGDSSLPHKVWEGTHAVDVIDVDSFALYVPADVPTFFDPGTPVPGDGTTFSGGTYLSHNPRKFYYDGIGPSTFRIERNWRGSNSFTQNQLGDDFTERNSHNHPESTPIAWDEVLTGTFSYVTATIDDVTVNEQDGTVAFTVRLAEPAKESVQISYTTADGSAISGVFDNALGRYVFDASASDFVAESGTVSFTPGQTQQTITIDLNTTNRSFDTTEQFYVDLTSISGGTIVKSRGVAVVEPDTTDPLPAITVQDTKVFPERGFAEFTVTLSNPSSRSVFVDYATADGTAKDGQDYLEQVASLHFMPNETSKTIRIEVLPDRLVEPMETFTLNLSDPQGGSIARATATAQIFDTAFVRITPVNPGGVVNGFGSGTETATFNVTLTDANGRPMSPPTDFTVKVNYATGGGSATPGVFGDYLAASGTLTFNPGETAKTISVTVNKDEIAEGDEFFFVTLTEFIDPVTGQRGNVVFLNPDHARTTVIIREPGEVVAADAGAGPAVRVFDGPSGTEKFTVFPFPRAFSGGVRVATGDMNGDGFPDIVAAAGPGGGPAIAVIDGLTGEPINSFFAFPAGFRGGVTVATGDIDGDGTLEIIAGADAGGGPVFAVFDAAGNTVIEPFLAFDADFRGGVRVAAGDVEGDGRDEIIVGSGPGQVSLVRVFDAETLTPVEKHTFQAYGDGFLGGVTVTAGDTTFDGFAEEIIVGTGEGGGPDVRVFEGGTGTLLGRFFAFNPGFRGGVRVATTDVNADGRAEIFVGAGPGGGPAVAYFSGATFAPIGGYFAFGPAFRGGVYVAGRSLGGFAEGSPLRVDTSVAPLAGPVQSITQSDLDPIVAAALTRFETAGLKADALQWLSTVEFYVTDLGGTLLGLARPGVVLIDDDAAGYGWFVDYSPLVDEEFGRDASGTLVATDEAAAGRVDLLSTVMHEMGHELGWKDLNPRLFPDDLMTATLPPGVRRDLDTVFASEDLFDALLTA